MTEATGTVIRLHFKERSALYQAYMSFSKDGGLYVPLGGELPLMQSKIFLLVELPESSQIYTASGKVTWINNGRRKGVGVRLNPDEHSRALRIAIENTIAVNMKSNLPTFTM